MADQFKISFNKDLFQRLPEVLGQLKTIMKDASAPRITFQALIEKLEREQKKADARGRKARA